MIFAIKSSSSLATYLRGDRIGDQPTLQEEIEEHKATLQFSTYIKKIQSRQQPDNPSPSSHLSSLIEWFNVI